MPIRHRPAQAQASLVDCRRRPSWVVQITLPKAAMPYQRILVPIDFSDASLTAFQLALDHYAHPDRTLVLLHVVTAGGGQDLAAQSAAAEEARRRITTLGNSRKAAWKDVETLVEAGKPTELIITTAQREGVDLVIMGSHGTGGVRQMLFGSTTYDVARKVRCSVLISKPD